MQIINVYNQEYESAAAFWPDVHGRIISALIISQLLLLGLLSTKRTAQSTPFLLALPVLTIAFYKYCQGRFEPAFVRYPLQVSQFVICSLFLVQCFLILVQDLTLSPLNYIFFSYLNQEAKMKDTLERAREPNLNLKGYLQSAYVHPVFKECDDDDDEDDHYSFEKYENESVTTVATKRQSRKNTPVPSRMTGGSPTPSLPEAVEDLQP